MDEYNQGMDPEVKIYFRKIVNSFAVFLLWITVIATLAFYFRLAIVHKSWQWYNWVFYTVFIASLIALLYYFYKLWRKEK